MTCSVMEQRLEVARYQMLMSSRLEAGTCRRGMSMQILPVFRDWRRLTESIRTLKKTLPQVRTTIVHLARMWNGRVIWQNETPSL